MAAFRQWLGPSPFTQLAVLALVLAGLVYFGGNVLATMDRLGLKPGFAFLSQRANFEIGESLIAYSASDSYGRALLAGLLNTVTVAFFGCMLATILGTLLGIMRLSDNLVISTAVRTYVELFRNTPLLLQLFLWSALFHALPAPRRAISLFDSIFLTNRGVFLPRPVVVVMPSLTGLVAALLAVGLVPLIARRLFQVRAVLRWQVVSGALAIIAIIAWVSGLSLAAEWPVKGGFNLSGGLSLTPEFAGLLTGLTLNSAAAIAEIVRSGIQSVGKGQWEAARALGLKPRQIMRLIVLPQALRVITPLMTSSYLDLTKNSSLAVAIGFPDLVSVANTIGNTTGQSLEAIVLIAGVYLLLNLGVSLLMNRYNRRLLAKEARRA
ncbi:amino acid ABC transporter permease [Xaviernesmea oryzae]|uniref:Amino acid ABC transporter permease n=1 Tax=Xaviernesmea oryzae TaxID=464029 RepID=A0A1Q9B1W3_9HYPH|nr:amino acid ABC transporter permease [Xaviernesmea oryzae]